MYGVRGRLAFACIKNLCWVKKLQKASWLSLAIWYNIVLSLLTCFKPLLFYTHSFDASLLIGAIRVPQKWYPLDGSTNWNWSLPLHVRLLKYIKTSRFQCNNSKPSLIRKVWTKESKFRKWMDGRHHYASNKIRLQHFLPQKYFSLMEWFQTINITLNIIQKKKSDATQHGI